MRILHTSDWHIGRQFHNVSLLDDQSYVLDQIISIAAESKVDVMLISGDIYDRSVPPASAIALLDDTLNRICADLKIPLIVITGNHDSPERLSFGSRQLKGAGLNIVGNLAQSQQPVVLEDQDGPVEFFCIPYIDPATVRHFHQATVSTHDQALSLVLSHIKQQRNPRLRSVVLSHVFLDGGEPSESERPLSLGGLDKVASGHYKSFNYAALGHLHGRQYKGAEHIRYSGSILKYSFSEEKQIKSVTLVEMDRAGDCVIEQVLLKPKRDMRTIKGCLEDILKAGANDPAKDDYLLVRLSDTHAILDIMNKLREVYPNVLHLERPGLLAAGHLGIAGRDHMKKGELSMFKDFVLQVSGEAITPEQSEIIEQALETIHSGKEV